jgi:hypothetical protein
LHAKKALLFVTVDIRVLWVCERIDARVRGRKQAHGVVRNAGGPNVLHDLPAKHTKIKLHNRQYSAVNSSRERAGRKARASSSSTL